MNIWVFWVSVAIVLISTFVISLCIIALFHNKTGNINSTSKKLYITIAIFAVLVITSIPFIINESYKVDKGYITMWRAESVLEFYGTIIGAIATIIAVILTIIYTNKQNTKHLDFQRRSFLAKIGENELKQEYSKILKRVSKINSIIMMDILVSKLIFDVSSLEKYLNNVLLNSYNRLVVGHNSNEIKFKNKCNEIITEISEIIDKYNDEFSKSSDVKKTLESIRTELLSYRKKYKEDYLDIYNNYLKYKKDEFNSNVEKLYDFELASFNKKV